MAKQKTKLTQQEANSVLDELNQKGGGIKYSILPAETRGRKPKEISISDVQDCAKELILKIRDYSDVKIAAGKNILRMNMAINHIQQMLRTHLID